MQPVCACCFVSHLFPLKYIISQSLLLLLRRFSRVRLCATPETEAHQTPPFLGFSRQEHWSGLPFPFPMHESEKWQWSCSVVSDSLQPHGLQPTRLLRPWNFPGKSTGVGCHCLLCPKPAEGRKCFPRVHWILKHSFYATGINKHFSLAKMCWL